MSTISRLLLALVMLAGSLSRLAGADASIPGWRECRLVQGVANRAQVIVEPVAGQVLPVARLMVPVRPEQDDQVSLELPLGTLPTNGTLTVPLRIIAGSGRIALGLVQRDGTRLAWTEVTPDKTWKPVALTFTTAGADQRVALVIQAGRNILTLEAGTPVLAAGSALVEVAPVVVAASAVPAKAPVSAASTPAVAPVATELGSDGGPALPMPAGVGSLMDGPGEWNVWLLKSPGAAKQVIAVRNQGFANAVRVTLPVASPTDWDNGIGITSAAPLKAGQRYALVVPYRGTPSPKPLLLILHALEVNGKEPSLPSHEANLSPTWQAWRVILSPQRDQPTKKLSVQVVLGARTGTIEMGQTVLRQINESTLPGYVPINLP